jgi:hypothetical protein
MEADLLLSARVPHPPRHHRPTNPFYNRSRSVTMPLFICRWQNGDFSAVAAASMKAAIELLDEVGNAETCELFTMKNFTVHFRLKQKTGESAVSLISGWR